MCPVRPDLGASLRSVAVVGDRRPRAQAYERDQRRDARAKLLRESAQDRAEKRCEAALGYQRLDRFLLDQYEPSLLHI